MTSKVDFVIATTNLKLAERCMTTIRESCADFLGSLIVVSRPQEVAYAVSVEQGWRAAREDYVCFVNDDAFPTGAAMSRLLEELERDPKAGAAGPGIPCRTHQGSAPRSERRLVVEVPFLTSACVVVRRSMLEEIGGWDTRYALYACDLDLTYRILDAGYKLLWVRDAWVNHILGASSEQVAEREELNKRDHALLNAKFPGRLGAYRTIPIEPVCERPTPGADGFAEKRYRMARERMNGVTNVLDMGCGWGTGARVFKDVRYTGIDVDEQCIGYAKAVLPGNFYVLPADDAVFDTGEYDGICAFEVLEHVSNPQQMLANAARVLKGGSLFLSTPDRRGVFNPHHVQEWTQPELEALLGHYFEDVSVEVKEFGFMAPTLWAECRRPRRERAGAS